MPDILRFIDAVLPDVPGYIRRHLNEITPRRLRDHTRRGRLIQFVEKDAARHRPDEETFSALQKIVLHKRHRHWREQIVAAWALGQADLTPDCRKKAAIALSSSLHYGGKGRGGQRTEDLIVGVSYALLWGTLNVALLMFCESVWNEVIAHNEIPISAILCFLLGVATLSLLLTPAIPFVTVACRVARMHQVRLEAARSLGSLGRAEGVPALLRASQNTDFFWKVGREALIRTLPSLRFEEHYGALKSEVVPDLCRLLEGSGTVDISTTLNWKWLLLGALEQIGDVRAIEPLTRLSQNRSAVSQEGSEVREEIVRVKQRLEERALRETAQGTLLRGAEKPISPETLLRSHLQTGDDSPETLLRVLSRGDE